jgi:hypothetical protein
MEANMSELPEMPATPEVPQPRKPTPWKVIVPVAIVVILCCLCIVAAGVMMYLGTQGIGPLSSLANSPILSSSPNVVGAWDLYYDWNCTGSYNGPVDLNLNTDGTFFATEDTSSGFGTWSVQGETLNFVYDDYPHAHYIGTVTSTGVSVDGTMSTDDGSNGCFYATKR